MFLVYSSPPWLFVTLFVSLTRSVCSSSPSFSSNTFQNFPGISDRLPKCFSTYKVTLYMQLFSSFFLKFKSRLLVIRVFVLEAACAMTILDLFYVYILHQLLLCYPNRRNISHTSVVFDVSSALGMVVLRFSSPYFFQILFHSTLSSTFN